MLKRTPLFSIHQRLGARLVEFGGWDMPVQYSGIVEEHQAVRRSAGLFDIAHMGEVRVSGPGALRFLNGVLTNDVARLEVGQGQYTLLTHERGGVVDDLYVYRVGAEVYLMVVNASRTEADLAWFRSRLAQGKVEGVILEDLSDDWGALAVQGPATRAFIDRTFSEPAVEGSPVTAPTALRRNRVAGFQFAGVRVWVARTGYTGEDGFELVAPKGTLESLWTMLTEDGAESGLVPCGLGARDTLRTEMGYPLYGHELDEDLTPMEAGLGAFVALGKGEFTGREALAAQKRDGTARRCVAFKMADRCPPPRPGYTIWEPGAPGRILGKVTSGTLSPSLGVGIGMGYVPSPEAVVGKTIEIEIRGRRFPAVTAAKPLYTKPV